MRVLVVEDERKLAQVVESALQAEHYDVVIAATGEDGFFRANAEVFDLIRSDSRGLQPSRRSPAAPGVGLRAIAQGFAELGLSDNERLRVGFPVYDALYACVSHRE